MVEGFVKILGVGKIVVISCGLEFFWVYFIVIVMMEEVGIDISGQIFDFIENFNVDDYDVVIFFCGCGVNLLLEWVIQEIFEDW